MSREAFLAAVDKERRDTRTAAISLTVLTVLGTLLLAVVLAGESAKRPYYPWLAGLALAYLYGAFLLTNDSERSDRPWIAAGGLVLAGPALLAFTPLPRAAPSLFWTLFSAGALAGCGCLGMAYRWRERYFGICWGGNEPRHYDDPTTLRDDRDRAHYVLATFTAPARLLLGGWADLFGRGWMREALEPGDVEAAVDILRKLSAHERGPLPSRPRAWLWLSKMGLIRRGESSWTLTRDGEALVRGSAGL